MKRITTTTTTAAVLALATTALLTGCGADAGQEPQSSAGSPQAATSPAPSPSKAPASKPSAPASNAGAAASESAYVAEAMSLKPELILARADLVKMGHEMCAAFREKPGSVATLVKNAKAQNMAADDVETLRVVAVAAIHNLCTDQSGDL